MFGADGLSLLPCDAIYGHIGNQLPLGGEPLLLLLLVLLPLTGLLGLRFLDILRAPLRGLGEPEYDEPELARLGGGPRPLRGETDLERE